MESLRAYIINWENGIYTSIPHDLPLPYHATKEFGDTLLKIQGREEQTIRDLFCIRTFALHYGISNALHLIREHIMTCTDTFPTRLGQLEDFPWIKKTDTGDLERAFLRWELASEIPDPDSVFPNSESKHIRSESVIEYSKIAMRVLEDITDISRYNYTNEYFKENIMLMIRKCNVLNLMYKLSHGPSILILYKILKEDIYPSVLVSVRGTSLPS
jgi:hypothetical protein